jgi:glycosyltransferase involved in cell wall biosynthesis
VAEPELRAEEKEDEVFVSVVLPAYEDAPRLLAHVPRLQAHLDGLGHGYEILICDDGSDDGGRTCEAAELLGCEYVRQPRNRGKGAALRAGMRGGDWAARPAPSSSGVSSRPAGTTPSAD